MALTTLRLSSSFTSPPTLKPTRISFSSPTLHFTNPSTNTLHQHSLKTSKPPNLTTPPKSYTCSNQILSASHPLSLLDAYPILEQVVNTLVELVDFFTSILFALLSPKKTKFRKHHRGRMKGIASRGNSICFGSYALEALEPAWITARQIEAGKLAMVRRVRRSSKIKIWVRIFPDKPVTMRPTETRMGSGKGTPEFWVSVVKPGRIIYEVSGVTETVARDAIQIAASKLPIRTRFVIKE